MSNRTRGFARTIVDVNVHYREDLDRVIRILRALASEFWNDPEWRGRFTEEPVVLGVEALAESAVTLRIVATTLPGKQWEVGRELRRRIKNRFDREGISIPFPHQTLHFDEASLLRMLSTRREEAPPGP